ncbi:cupin domain-containing protein [Modicisalibacter luteus]|uniref:hypothetical protein n=1 Tax=Modicisalibacter luteus TaxID=453962 RepID=UPI00362CAAE9
MSILITSWSWRHRVSRSCRSRDGERITRERGCLIPSTYHHEYVGDGANRTLVMDIPLANLGLTSCADEVGRLFERPRFFEVPVALYQLANGLLPR